VPRAVQPRLHAPRDGRRPRHPRHPRHAGSEADHRQLESRRVDREGPR